MPKTVSILFDNGYRINAVHANTEPKTLIDDEICGVDLEEIHLAVAHTGDKIFMLNGDFLGLSDGIKTRTKAHFSRKLLAM